MFISAVPGQSQVTTRAGCSRSTATQDVDTKYCGYPDFSCLNLNIKIKFNPNFHPNDGLYPIPNPNPNLDPNSNSSSNPFPIALR